MTDADIESLVRIFGDAKVIDIDMSQWDRWIGVLVLTDQFIPSKAGQPLPGVLVRFHQVDSLNVAFQHAGAPNHGLEAGEHFQWWVYEFDHQAVDGEKTQYVLSGSDFAPRLVMVCRRVTYEVFDGASLKAAFPGVFKIGASFARRGVKTLLSNV